MTITTNDVRDEYTASAAQTVFNYTFKIFADGQLNVYITPSGQVADDSTDITTAYTIDPSSIGDEDGGFITLDSGTSNGDLVTIVSNIPEARTTDYQNSGDFLPDTVNADFDTVVSLVKQVEDKAARTLAFQESEQGASSLTLPAPSATQFMRWRADELGLENVDLAVSGTPTNANIITYSAGNNFVGGGDRTQENKNEDRVSLLDYTGSDKSGTTDNDTALSSALTNGKLLGGEIHLPVGTYNNTGINISDTDQGSNNNPVNFTGEGKAATILAFTESSGTAFRVRPDNCKISMLTIDGPATGTADGLLLKDTSSSGPKHTTITDVQIKDFTGGVGVINDGFANAAYGLFVSNNDIGWLDDGSGGHTLIAHAFITNNLTYGMQVDGSLRHMQLDSVNVESNPTGIFSGGSSAGVGSLLMNSCHMEGNDDRDIRIGNGTHDLIINGGRYDGLNSTSLASILHVGDSDPDKNFRIYLNGPEFVDNGQGVNTEIFDLGPGVELIVPSLDAMTEGMTRDSITLDDDAYVNTTGTIGRQQEIFGSNRLNTSAASGSFTVGETVTGGTSGETGIVQDDTGSILKLKHVSDFLTTGETLTGATSGVSATFDDFNQIQPDLEVGSDLIVELAVVADYSAAQATFSSPAHVLKSKMVTMRIKQDAVGQTPTFGTGFNGNPDIDTTASSFTGVTWIGLTNGGLLRGIGSMHES